MSSIRCRVVRHRRGWSECRPLGMRSARRTSTTLDCATGRRTPTTSRHERPASLPSWPRPGRGPAAAAALPPSGIRVAPDRKPGVVRRDRQVFHRRCRFGHHRGVLAEKNVRAACRAVHTRPAHLSRVERVNFRGRICGTGGVPRAWWSIAAAVNRELASRRGASTARRRLRCVVTLEVAAPQAIRRTDRGWRHLVLPGSQGRGNAPETGKGRVETHTTIGAGRRHSPSSSAASSATAGDGLLPRRRATLGPLGPHHRVPKLGRTSARRRGDLVELRCRAASISSLYGSSLPPLAYRVAVSFSSLSWSSISASSRPPGRRRCCCCGCTSASRRTAAPARRS